MVYTSMTSFTTDNICLNPHSADAICVMGVLGENAVPGQVVVFTESTGVWMLADSDDSQVGNKFQRVGVVGYKRRVNPSTLAQKTITDAYVYNSAGDKLVPIWISGIVCAYIIDLNTNWPAGGELAISATAGSLQQTKLEDVTSTTTPKPDALCRVSVATAAIRIKDGDTKTIIGLGKCAGMIWGGWNTS